MIRKLVDQIVGFVDDLVSMILLREKNVRQMKSLERELNLLRKQG